MTVLAGSEPPYCPLNTIEPSVTICAPTASSTSPVRVVGGTTSASAVQEIDVLVDGVTTYATTNSNAVDAFVNVPPGSHTLALRISNAGGQKFSAIRSVTVSGSGTSPCGNRGIQPSVSICSPLPGSVTGGSIHVLAQSVGLTMVSSTAVLLDGREVYSVFGGKVDTYITAAPGPHRISIQSTDSGGSLWSSTARITVQQENSS